MPQHSETDEDTRLMALSYSSGLPAARAQTLPSFSELLPPHLHAEIDSASFPVQSWKYKQTGPVPAVAAESASKPRPALRPPSFPSPLKIGDTNQDIPLHPSSTHRSQTGSRRVNESLSIYHSEHPTPPSGMGSTSPCGSPSLPPIRDLRPHPERDGNWLGTSFEDTPLGRPNSFSHDFRASSREPLVFHSRNLPGPDNGGTPLAYGQQAYDNPRYVHYPAAYRSDSDCSPLSHSPQSSNFGVLGDSIDPRGKRRRGNLPKPVTDILRAWFHEHLDHPYPSEEDKQIFMSRTGLSISQISNWFINARRRQLPALRNQIRNNDVDRNMIPQSPLSDVDQTSSQASGSSPSRSMHNLT
ncbi:Homeobox KN domain containing protein [Elaphomyces granulatus]